MNARITLSHPRRFARFGFTLVELMIVVAVIAIIAAVAYPAYINSVVKTKRAAAQGCLSQYATYMERFYTQNLRYDKVADGTAENPVVGCSAKLILDCASPQSLGADYRFCVAATRDTYTVSAAPTGAQRTRDTACGDLSINQLGTKTASGSDGAAKCWSN